MTLEPLAATTGGLPGDPGSRRLMRWLPLVGVAVALAGLGLLGVVAMTDRRQAAIGLATAALLFVFGKEGSIPIGLANGGWPWLVATMIWVADVASMCVLYPLVDRGLDEVERRRGFGGRFLATLRKRGERRKKWAVRYGQLGLYGFMLIPFAFNGPLQAAVVGRLAGLRPARILPVLVAGITTTTVAWTVVATTALSWFPKGGGWISAGVSLGVGLCVVGGLAVAARREKRLEEREAAGARAGATDGPRGEAAGSAAPEDAPLGPGAP